MMKLLVVLFIITQDNKIRQALQNSQSYGVP